VYVLQGFVHPIARTPSTASIPLELLWIRAFQVQDLFSNIKHRHDIYQKWSSQDKRLTALSTHHSSATIAIFTAGDERLRIDPKRGISEREPDPRRAAKGAHVARHGTVESVGPRIPEAGDGGGEPRRQDDDRGCAAVDGHGRAVRHGDDCACARGEPRFLHRHRLEAVCDFGGPTLYAGMGTAVQSVGVAAGVRVCLLSNRGFVGVSGDGCRLA